MLKNIYNWVLSWADSPYGGIALFLIAFCESSFFPIPPDILLIALAIGASQKALKYALICSVGSLLGGCLGYIIGWQFMDVLGAKIISVYGLTDYISVIRQKFELYNAWIVFSAGFTPIPYKVFTIAAGFFKVNFPVFFIASAVSRSARFFLVAGLIFLFGASIKSFIDKYFNLLAIAFTILLIGSFFLVKVILA
jgi:membrane protein YqaA with SNARE-associated domain